MSCLTQKKKKHVPISPVARACRSHIGVLPAEGGEERRIFAVCHGEGGDYTERPCSFTGRGGRKGERKRRRGAAHGKTVGPGTV